MWRAILILSLVSFALAPQDAIAQPVPQPAAAQSAPAGSAGGPCYAGATCDQGFVCDPARNVCLTRAPAAGSAGGMCYGNGTCNAGLSCSSATNQCVGAAGAPAPAAQPYPAPTPAPAPYNANTPPPPPPLPPAQSQFQSSAPYATHEGFMAGFGLGASYLTCEDCDDSEAGLALDFHLGTFLNPRMALQYDYSAWFDSEDDVSVTLSIHAITAQYWLSPMFWVKGGAGIARISLDAPGGDASESGFGATGAAGVDLFHSGKFALDISGRLSSMTIEELDVITLNFVLGARWR